MTEPEHTGARVALWRALHVRVDAPPHVFDDEVGLRLIDPPEDWTERPDMDITFTRGMRAGVAARARFIEDLVIEQGVGQYVLLGAGLDTFAQRRTDVDGVRVFEVDQPAAQDWKRARLVELGYGVPDRLSLVPVDFEAGEDWLTELLRAGFDPACPAVVASTGVSMYLSTEANLATLRQAATLAPGSTLAMTFQLPLDLLAEQDRPLRELAERGARGSGTPFISFYSPADMVELAAQAGFRTARHVSSVDIAERYFAHREDGLRPLTGEDFLVATT
ncbi:MAG TPA: class I SAM-dependent methyltransferase [Pseudonocardiaceae bacterium]